jgi:hypothetical protein
MSGPARSTASLTAELQQLRESMENAYRRLGLMQRRVRALSGHDGQGPTVVEIFEVVAPKSREIAAPPAIPSRVSGSAWPLSRVEGRPLRPTPGLANLTLTGRDLPAVGFSVCGFAREDLARLVDLVANKQAADRNFVPVFLTDTMAADIFRHHRYVFEYFPSEPDRRLQGCEPWADYARRRLALIKRKYALTQIVAFGKQPFCDA